MATGTRMKNELVLQLAHKDVIIRELESKVQHQNSIQSELANYQELASSLENEVMITMWIKLRAIAFCLFTV